MNNILIRTLSGSVFIAVIITAVLFGNFIQLAIFTIFTLLGIFEFVQFFKNDDQINPSLLGAIAFNVNIIFLAVLAMIFQEGVFLLLNIPIFFLLFIVEMYRQKGNPILNMGILLLSTFYITIPLLLLSVISFMTGDAALLILGMFVLIWTNDTFAFLSGKFFGKTKLIERISPKKTWEGTIGGIILTGLMAFSFALLFDETHKMFWMVSAILLSICAIFGDLLESLMKRTVNVKDSGNIMPGHGGILDRFDATLLAVPFYFIWILIYFQS